MNKFSSIFSQILSLFGRADFESGRCEADVGSDLTIDR